MEMVMQNNYSRSQFKNQFSVCLKVKFYHSNLKFVFHTTNAVNAVLYRKIHNLKKKWMTKSYIFGSHLLKSISIVPMALKYLVRTLNMSLSRWKLHKINFANTLFLILIIKSAKNPLNICILAQKRNGIGM